MRGFGLAHHPGDQRIHGDVERLAGLVAGGEDLGRQAIAGVVDLADEIARAQLELEQQRVGGILQGVVHLFGAVGDAVDDGRRALLEFAGDAVDALVQHLMDTIGQIDELVMDVAGLEVKAGGQPLGGVQHGAGGLGAGFLKTVEQVATALAQREDHVVAGMTQGAGDVGASFFQRAGDALGHFVDARGDCVRNQRDVVAEVDLHAGDGATHLLGLADQIVALMGDVLQQRANAHFIVGIGALERGNLVCHQRFEFAGARDRAFDAVAHRRDLAADRLSDGHHGIGGGAFGLGEADSDLRHRLRNHPHFLAAPGEACEEVEQQHRCEEKRGKAAEHQHAAALADRRLQRRKEARGQKTATDEPDARKSCGKRIDAARRAALLQGLQNLSDRLTIVVGGAPGAARFIDRFEHRTIGARAGVERQIGKARCRSGNCRRRNFAVDRTAIRLCTGFTDVQGFLDGRKRDFGGIFDLLGIVRHVQSKPSVLVRVGQPADVPRKPEAGVVPKSGAQAYPSTACPLHPETSYWLRDANEMVAIKTFLIIVNSFVP